MSPENRFGALVSGLSLGVFGVWASGLSFASHRFRGIDVPLTYVQSTGLRAHDLCVDHGPTVLAAVLIASCIAGAIARRVGSGPARLMVRTLTVTLAASVVCVTLGWVAPAVRLMNAI